MHGGHYGRCTHVTGIDIALIVGRDYYAALAVLKATAQYGILILRNHLGKYQGGSHSTRCMARRIRTACTQTFQIISLSGGNLVEPDYRTYAHIFLLGILGGLLGRMIAARYQVVYGRSLRAAYLKIQRLGEYPGHHGCT